MRLTITHNCCGKVRQVTSYRSLMFRDKLINYLRDCPCSDGCLYKSEVNRLMAYTVKREVSAASPGICGKQIAALA